MALRSNDAMTTECNIVLVTVWRRKRREQLLSESRRRRLTVAERTELRRLYGVYPGGSRVST
jgi:hypothetical protein